MSININRCIMKVMQCQWFKTKINVYQWKMMIAYTVNLKTASLESNMFPKHLTKHKYCINFRKKLIAIEH